MSPTTIHAVAACLDLIEAKIQKLDEDCGIVVHRMRVELSDLETRLAMLESAKVQKPKKGKK